MIADALYEQGVLALGEPTGGQHTGQQRVGLAEQFPRATEIGERQRLPVEVVVRKIGQGGEGAERRGDHSAVEADGTGPVEVPTIDEGSAGRQRVQLAEEPIEPGFEQLPGGVPQLFPADPPA
ncbi:hypothetical protein GCM10029963_60800 [Micromonospora andamanensis]